MFLRFVIYAGIYGYWGGSKFGLHQLQCSHQRPTVRRTPSYHLISPVVKHFSPPTSSSPWLSSAPGNLKKLFPAVVVTHGVARARGQSKLVLQPSSCQFYQIPSSCSKIWLQQSYPFSQRGSFVPKVVRVQVDGALQGEGLVCWNVLVAELGDTWGKRLGGTTPCWWALALVESRRQGCLCGQRLPASHSATAARH